MLTHTSIHLRKKRQSKKKFHPIDLIVDVAVVVAPLSLLPQLVVIWKDGATAGVSMATWALTLLITIPLIIYDMKYRAYKLVLMHSSIVVICFGIVLGLMIY